MTEAEKAAMVQELDEYAREQWKLKYAEKKVKGFSVCGINLEKPGETFKLLLALEAADRQTDHDA